MYVIWIIVESTQVEMLMKLMQTYHNQLNMPLISGHTCKAS